MKPQMLYISTCALGFAQGLVYPHPSTGFVPMTSLLYTTEPWFLVIFRSKKEDKKMRKKHTYTIETCYYAQVTYMANKYSNPDGETKR
ncbi:hypothetical protein F5Y16DRAFT_83703 [Xylariaceae sp. FL0255]|nr:hypothetical protein F5Y16DRAFT_83703 [Xylariaceae sp. FL0255]